MQNCIYKPELSIKYLKKIQLTFFFRLFIIDINYFILFFTLFITFANELRQILIILVGQIRLVSRAVIYALFA